MAGSNKAEPPNAFGILAIAVAPAAKRKVTGRSLMDFSENTAPSWGAEKMGLSVAVDNTEANRFYENLGWQRILEEGVWKGRMVEPL